MPLGHIVDVQGVDLLTIAAAPALAYLLLAGLVALDAMFPAVPSDLAVVSAGALAATGHLGLGWSAAAVIVGAMAGDHVVYSVGRHWLPGMLERSRLGRRVHQNVVYTHTRLLSVGTVALALGRFVPFGRTATAATAGLVGVPPRHYLWVSLLGSTTWAAWMVGLGYVAGQAAGGPLWRQIVIATAVGLAAGFLLAGVQRALSRRRPRHSARAWHRPRRSTTGPSSVRGTDPSPPVAVMVGLIQDEAQQFPSE